MKKIVKVSLIVFTLLAVLFSFAACNTVDAEGLWESATYRRDKSFGSGDTEITLTVEAGEQSVVFTVKTDKSTLADALTEHGIISGEETEYGLSVYTVNGITANWNTDKAYWALYVGEDYATSGVSFIEIKNGDAYRFVYTAT
ncbi:MAG: DUF4430 domain-containing protein [Clostridia bacterium]|nr:DUF4430 domain-containing protein [Clostridia bacterium]